MKKRGFTLAELLIVLVIIGLLATLTLLSVGTSVDKNKMLFKKAYSVLEESVAELVNDETLYPYSSTKLGFRNTVQVKIPGTDGSDTIGVPCYSRTANCTIAPTTGNETNDVIDKFSVLLQNHLNVIPTTDSEKAICERIDENTKKKPDRCFKTTDGILWAITPSNLTGEAAKYRMRIVLDVNSDSKPNSTSGENDKRDQFNVYVKPDGKVYIDSNDTTEISYLKSQTVK